MNVIFNFGPSQASEPGPEAVSLRATGDQGLEDAGDQGAQLPGADCRCLCGNLLARVVGDRVELKCRRCKRTLLVPLARPRRSALTDWKLAPPSKAGAS
jgi:hypothetical protein